MEPSSVPLFWPLPSGVASAASVAQTDVEIPVWPEGDLAPVVVAERLGDLHDYELAVGVGLVWIIWLDGEPGEDRSAGTRGRVVHVEKTVVLVVRVEGEAEQALFEIGLANSVADVQEDAGSGGTLVVGEGEDTSHLLGDKKMVAPVVGLDQVR